MLAVFTLWTLTVYLAKNDKAYVITLLPALFMTAVTTTYIVYAPEGIGIITDSLWGVKISYEIAVAFGLGVTALFGGLFFRFLRQRPSLSVMA